MTETWTNRHKFNGISKKDLYVRKGEAVWDPSRRVPYKHNANGIVHAVFKDGEVLVKWYDIPKDKFEVFDKEDFINKWTDKYGGGYWLDDATAPAR